MDAKKIKSIVKTNVANKATFGTNPKDPWSTKSELAETAGLDKYLLSRGINPKFVSKDTKVAHSKSNQFKQWARDHAMKEDTVSPSPTMDRLRQIKKKEREGKVIHHEEVEQVNELTKGTLNRYKAKATLNAVGHASNIYNREVEGGKSPDAKMHQKLAKRNAGIEKATSRLNKEDSNICTECNEDPCACSHGFVEGNLAEADKHSMLGKIMRGHELRKKVDKSFDSWGAAQKTGDKKKASKAFRDHERYTNLERPGTWTKVNEQGVSEAKEADYGGDYQSSVHALKAKAEKKPVDMKSLAARMQASYRRDNEAKKVKAIPAMKENVMDPSAPTQGPVDGANSSNDCEPQPTKQPQISKAAKIIKSLKKSKVVKEDLYDHEKEDKPVKTSKKTTFEKPGQDDVTKEQPQAAAVLSGGKTMTGAPRDVVEIDPMMKMRKQTPDSQKNV